MTISSPKNLRRVTPLETPKPAAPPPPPRNADGKPAVERRRSSDSFQPSGINPGRRATDRAAAVVPPTLAAKLSSKDRATLAEVEAGKKGTWAKADLEALAGTSAFARLDEATQLRALKAFAAEPDASITNGLRTELVNSAAFAQLSPSQRAQALDVFDHADTAGQGHLVELAARQMNGKTALLDQDAEGKTLLDRLQSLATQPLSADAARAGLTPEGLLGSVLKECATPGEVNQDIKNTCTATSMQYLLCDQDPAEFARLMEGLVHGDGEVRMRNGDELKVERDALADDDAHGRSDSERIFQSAVMEYANGSESYSNEKDESSGKRLGIFGYERTGLKGDQQEKALQALFGRDFKEEDDDLVDLLADRSPTDTYVRMKWGEGKEGGHAVVVTRVENGRVYFRNPWGPTSDPNGTSYSDPPRRLENRSIREESMSVEDFERWAKSAIIPD